MQKSEAVQNAVKKKQLSKPECHTVYRLCQVEKNALIHNTRVMHHRNS